MSAVASARQQNGCHLLSHEMQNGVSDPSHGHLPASLPGKGGGGGGGTDLTLGHERWCIK